MISPSKVDPLKLAGPWECQECLQESPSANTIYRHVAIAHASRHLSSLTVKHVATGRVYQDTALYRYVVTCGAAGCHKFAGRNKALTQAVEKLRHHWGTDHGDQNMGDFTYDNISLEHDDTSASEDNPEEEDVSMSLDNVKAGGLHQDPANDLSSEIQLKKLDQELFLQDCEGPFTCLVSGCNVSLEHGGRISVHYNKFHTALPVKDVLFKNSQGKELSLGHFYKNILQCSLCNLVRCSVQEWSSKVSNKMDIHILSDHKNVSNFQDHYTILVKTTENGSFVHPEIMSIIQRDEHSTSVSKKKCMKQSQSTNKSASIKIKTPASVNTTPKPGLNNSDLDVSKVRKVLDMTAPASASLSVSVAVSDDVTSNMTFISKGWRGPYHCLAPGCDWVYRDTIHHATQRALLSHWQAEHGEDLRPMLYFDESSSCVLNVKAWMNILSQNGIIIE